MKHGDQAAPQPMRHGADLTGRLWELDEFLADEDRSAVDLTSGLVSLGFIGAALRRAKWFLCATAVIGLLFGYEGLKKFPPAYQASATITLSNNIPGSPGVAVGNATVIAGSRTVAAAALRILRLPLDPVAFAEKITATALTNNAFAVTVKAPSSQAAVSETNAVAKAFLAVQAQQLRSQQRLLDASLQQGINAARQNVTSISQKISSLSAQPPSPAQGARLKKLRADRNDALIELNLTQQANLGAIAGAKAQNQTMIKESKILDWAAPLPRHTKRYLLLFVGGGLIAGLGFGVFIVIIRELVSDRLRRRDDVARAIGAPVRLSVTKLQLNRWRPGPRALATAPGPRIRRIADHFDSAISASSPSLATLAVVPVDEPQVAALSLATLAVSYAQQGRRVIVADLFGGSPAGRWLGATEPGMHEVRIGEAHLLVAVRDADDVAPAGPLSPTTRRASRTTLRESAFSDEVTAACASADLLLTLAALDPAVGGDHLAGWAHSAVAVVSAGRSSAERIHSTGEMIRLAGTELISAVLVGADNTDESLGEIVPSNLQDQVDRGLG